MNKIYLINYDLYRTGQDYTSLIDEIKRSQDWIKYLKSGWIVASGETIHQLYERLAKRIDSNDCILISEFNRNYYGYLAKLVWQWLNKYGF